MSAAVIPEPIAQLQLQLNEIRSWPETQFSDYAALPKGHTLIEIAFSLPTVILN
jgi:hypothetical protein